MKVGLVSCVHEKTGPPKTSLSEILETVRDQPSLDLLLFSGWTVSSDDYRTFLEENKNPRSIVVLQEEDGSGFPPYHFVQGRRDLTNARSLVRQIFADRKVTTPELADLLYALEHERKVEVAGKMARLIICGENNLLRNLQSDGNRVLFRDDGLADRFERIRRETGIFLNPAHTPMGELGKLKRRWSYLSSGAKLSLYTTNAPDRRLLGQKRLQYAFADEKELRPIQGPVIHGGLRLAVYEWGP